MNKKGFTLIEILAVIVLIGIIGSASLAVLIRNYKISKQKLSYQNAKEIVDTSEAYFASNHVSSVSIKDLLDGGYLDTRVQNPRNNKTEWDTGEMASTIITKDYSYELQDGYTAVDCGDGVKACYTFDGYQYKMINR